MFDAPCRINSAKNGNVFQFLILPHQICNNLDIKLVFSSFTIRNMFSVKDPIPTELRSRVVYKFSCASCNACYVGETSRHPSARIREDLTRDRSSHIFQRLQQSEVCRSLCSDKCFSILDLATTKYQVKIKEALHIQWETTCFK